MRRDKRLVTDHVDEMDGDKALLRAHFPPGTDSAKMVGIAQTNNGSSGCPRPLKPTLHRLAAYHLAIGHVAVQQQIDSGVRNQTDMAVDSQRTDSGVPHILRDQPDAVAVMPKQVGLDQIMRHLLRLIRIAAGPSDHLRDQVFQCVMRDGDHCSLPKLNLAHRNDHKGILEPSKTEDIYAVMRQIEFLKMHGLGNDFVVLDGRRPGPVLAATDYRAVGDRRRGVGYDQFLTIEAPKNGGDAFMRIHNPDGKEASACGNGTRCVADLVMDELETNRIDLETVSGTLACERIKGGRIKVDMGPARLEAAAIPLSVETDTLSVEIPDAPYSGACCVNMGNPHAVFFVDDVEAVKLAEIGPKLERHPIFPNRANIEFVEIRGPELIRMRVWERGAGITAACGSGACAVLVAAARKGLTKRKADVELDGGVLGIEWREDGHVLMTGPVATSFRGTLDLDRLA